MCFSYKVAKAVQTVKLTPYHRSTASLLESSIIGFAKGVDIQTLIHRNEPNRPHISSVYSIVKQRQVIRPRDKNQHEAPISTGANRVNTASNSFQTSLPEPSSQSAPSAQQHLSAAGEGGSSPNSKHPQPKKSQKSQKSTKRSKNTQNQQVSGGKMNQDALASHVYCRPVSSTPMKSRVFHRLAHRLMRVHLQELPRNPDSDALDSPAA